MADEWTKAGLRPRKAMLMEATLAAVADEMKRQNQRIAALEADRHKTLRDMFKGGFMPNTDYREGDVIADRNALWLCMSATEERPGSTSAWKLIMKAPR